MGATFGWTAGSATDPKRASTTTTKGLAKASPVSLPASSRCRWWGLLPTTTTLSTSATTTYHASSARPLFACVWHQPPSTPPTPPPQPPLQASGEEPQGLFFDSNIKRN